MRPSAAPCTSPPLNSSNPPAPPPPPSEPEGTPELERTVLSVLLTVVCLSSLGSLSRAALEITVLRCSGAVRAPATRFKTCRASGLGGNWRGPLRSAGSQGLGRLQNLGVAVQGEVRDELLCRDALPKHAVILMCDHRQPGRARHTRPGRRRSPRSSTVMAHVTTDIRRDTVTVVTACELSITATRAVGRVALQHALPHALLPHAASRHARHPCCH